MGVCPFTHLAYAVLAKPYLAFVPDVVENVDFAPRRIYRLSNDWTSKRCGVLIDVVPVFFCTESGRRKLVDCHGCLSMVVSASRCLTCSKSLEEITSTMRINGLKFRSVLKLLSVVSCKLAMKYGHENHLRWPEWPKARYILGQIGVGGGLERD